MNIPSGALTILKTFRQAGFEAYVVGGCVRDSILGRVPGDWDICTSALPEETKALFKKTVDTGIKHGTVTVLLKDERYEVTTFRQDGEYLDHRKPREVTFVRSLTEDLRRRDFTVNAMAMDEFGVISDPFGGQEDLKKGILRAVGDGNLRFQEDSLRILRGLRFSAQLGFSLEESTVLAMKDNRHLLKSISGERIYQELCKLIMAPYAVWVLRTYPDIIGEVLPEILPTMGFFQHTPYHHLDVWEHTLSALEAAPEELYLRWTMLLHDLGKPETFSLDERGHGHFYGHAEKSGEIAQRIFSRFHTDNLTRNTVCLLVSSHGDMLPESRKSARKWVGKFGEENLQRLLTVKRCDILGIHPDKREAALKSLEASAALFEDLLQEESCFTLKDLNISGRDLMELGVKAGPGIGRLLNQLLDEVLWERLSGSREALLLRAKELIGKELL